MRIWRAIASQKGGQAQMVGGFWFNFGSGNFMFEFDGITAVPEPTNYALAAFGLVLVGVGVGRFYCDCRSAAAS